MKFTKSQYRLIHETIIEVLVNQVVRGSQEEVETVAELIHAKLRKHVEDTTTAASLLPLVRTPKWMIELMPHTDRWMRGDRYADLIKIVRVDKRAVFMVKLHKSKHRAYLTQTEIDTLYHSSGDHRYNVPTLVATSQLIPVLQGHHLI